MGVGELTLVVVSARVGSQERAASRKLEVDDAYYAREHASTMRVLK